MPGKNERARKPLKIKGSGIRFFMFALAFALAAGDQLLPAAGTDPERLQVIS